VSLDDFPHIPEVRRQKIRTAALTFRIWQHAMQRGWDVTMPQTAEALGVPCQTVSAIATHNRWLNRFRATKPQDRGTGVLGYPLSYDLFQQTDLQSIAKDLIHV
jgi:hypothetical protein